MRPGKGRHPVAEGTSADAAFHIESRGIAPVPEEGRHGNAAELFWLWVGSDLLILFPATGALLTMTGLSFGQAVIAILVGNLSYAVLGLTSLQGPATGTATFTVTRASFGRNGGRGLSGLNWITCVGWEATGVTLVTLSAVAAVEAAGWSHPPAVAKLAILVVTVAALGLLPLLGHQTIVVVQRWVSYLLLPVFVGVAVVAWPHVHLGAIHHDGNLAVLSIGIAIIVSAGGLTWSNAGSDYTRYLPRDTSLLRIFAAVCAGGFLPTVALELLGAAVATSTRGASDPITGMTHVLPVAMLLPYLVVVSTTTMLAQSIDLYSSGLSLQALGLRLSRTACVCIDLVIAGSLGAVALFNDGFNRLYSDFLSLVVVWMAPWAAVYLADWALRRGRYDVEGLLATRGGPYWQSGGVRIAGVAALVAGMVAAVVFLHAPFLEAPGSRLLGGIDASIPAGLIVGALAYVALAGSDVAAETRLLDASAP
jgi:purine-cytosine permease-like protein